MLVYLPKNPSAFNPETVRILSDALDNAWRQVQADKITYKIVGNPESAREVLAKHIVDMAKEGERDEQRLVQGAMERLKL